MSASISALAPLRWFVRLIKPRPLPLHLPQDLLGGVPLEVFLRTDLINQDLDLATACYFAGLSVSKSAIGSSHFPSFRTGRDERVRFWRSYGWRWRGEELGSRETRSLRMFERGPGTGTSVIAATTEINRRRWKPVSTLKPKAVGERASFSRTRADSDFALSLSLSLPLLLSFCSL